jgi:hypothetical protein
MCSIQVSLIRIIPFAQDWEERYVSRVYAKGGNGVSRVPPLRCYLLPS